MQNFDPDSKSYRAILSSDKFKKITKKPSLLRQKASERIEYQLVKFGSGQIFGETPHIIEKEIKRDGELQKIVEMAD